MPSNVLEASPSAPYLCCKIDLDLAALADLIFSLGGASPKNDLSVLAVYPSDPDLVDAACRLVRLLDRPDDIATLAPLIEREILYRLLIGPHGAGKTPLVAAVAAHLRDGGRRVCVLSRGYGREGDTVAVGDLPNDVAVSPDNRYVVVPNALDPTV